MAKYTIMVLYVHHDGIEEFQELQAQNGKLTTPCIEGPDGDLFYLFNRSDVVVDGVRHVTPHVMFVAGDAELDRILPEEMLLEAQITCDSVQDGQHRATLDGMSK